MGFEDDQDEILEGAREVARLELELWKEQQKSNDLGNQLHALRQFDPMKTIEMLRADLAESNETGSELERLVELYGTERDLSNAKLREVVAIIEGWLG